MVYYYISRQPRIFFVMGYGFWECFIWGLKIDVGVERFGRCILSHNLLLELTTRCVVRIYYYLHHAALCVNVSLSFVFWAAPDRIWYRCDACSPASGKTWYLIRSCFKGPINNNDKKIKNKNKSNIRRCVCVDSGDAYYPITYY